MRIIHWRDPKVLGNRRFMYVKADEIFTTLAQVMVWARDVRVAKV